MLSSQLDWNSLYGRNDKTLDMTWRNPSQIISFENEMSYPTLQTISSVEDGLHSPGTPADLGVTPYSTGTELTQPSSLYFPRAIRGVSYSEGASLPEPPPPLLSRNTHTVNTNAGSLSNLDISEMMNNLSLSPSRGLLSLTEQELANLRALHALTSTSDIRTFPLQPPQSSQVFDNRFWSYNYCNQELHGGYEKNKRNQNGYLYEAPYTWSGFLPRRLFRNATFSCKVFLGGLPWDVTEETLIYVFSQFGKVRVEWPGKENAVSQPKGYVYIIFESENQVKALLNNCACDFSNGENENWYFRISSKKMKSKEVQVIPWSLSDSNYVQGPSQKLDPHTTVFVGALHGMMSAECLFRIMDDLFGGVIYVGIDTDKFKYPIGSARVTFNNKHSYMKAVLAAFIEIRTNRFTKRIQVDPYLEDSICSVCTTQQGPYFCRDMHCFRYFCRECWELHHQSDYLAGHKPLVRSSKQNASSSPLFRYTFN